MPLDLELDDLSQPSNESETGSNDVLTGDISISDEICQQVKSEVNIILLEAEIINENTEFEPDVWIQLYAERFREIIEENPNLTKSQIKYELYACPKRQSRDNRRE